MLVEKIVLKVLDSSVTCYSNPTVFVGGISFKTAISEQVRQAANYFTEVYLLDNEYITIDTSRLAAAAIYLARKPLHEGDWV